VAAQNGILQAVRAVQCRLNESILEGMRQCAAQVKEAT